MAVMAPVGELDNIVYLDQALNRLEHAGGAVRLFHFVKRWFLKVSSWMTINIEL